MCVPATATSRRNAPSDPVLPIAAREPSGSSRSIGNPASGPDGALASTTTVSPTSAGYGATVRCCRAQTNNKDLTIGVGTAGSLSPLSPEIEDLGRAPFAAVRTAMRALHGDVVAGRDPGRILLVEHDPVYTAGRATPPHELTSDIVPIERGGRITFHGPGQLVVYPIVRLPRRDVRDWLRRLERFGVGICAAFGLHAEPSVDGTGVFIADRKVASIGVAIKQWVNLHGIAINVAMDLAAWQRVRPCGLSPDVMTDLRSAAGRPIDLSAAKAAARAAILDLMAP